MAINNGVGRIGMRSYVATPTQITASTLLTSLYSVWNGETTGTSLDSGIVGVWNGEGNTNDSVGSNHGTAVGGLTYSTGKIVQTFNFNGSSCVDLGDVMDIGTKSWSYSMWIKTNVVSGFTTIFSKAMTESFGGRFGILTSNNFIKVFFDPTGSNTITADSSTTISTNTWYHLVFQIDRNDKLKLYINGVLNNIVTKDGVNNLAPYVSSNYNRPTTFKIGAYTNTNGTPNQFFNGQIDGFSVWDRLLTADEVVQLYNAGNGTQYPFSSQTLPSSANQFAVDNATLMNGCTFTDGKVGKAFTFDGVNDYVALPDNSLNFTGDFTTSFWFYVNSFTSQDSFISNDYFTGGSNEWGWYILQYNGKLGLSIYNAPNSISWESNTTISTGSWTHVVVVKQLSTSPKFYINGILVGTSIRSGTNTSLNPGYNTTTQYCCIGANKYTSTQNHAYLNGKIDGVSMWQKTLTQAEVTELYNSGNGKQLTVDTKIVTTGLLLNLDATRKSSYPNTGTTLYDISGNGYNGTMINGPVFGTASGGVITFDGVNDYVSIPTITSLQGNPTFTVCGWFRKNSDWSQGSTWGIGGDISTYGINSWNFDKINDISIDLWGNTTYTTNQKYTNEWKYIAWVYSGTAFNTTNIKIYIDNVLYTGSNLTALRTGSMTPNITGGVVIGRAGVSTGNYYSKPSISNFSIYNRPLSATELLQNFNATKSRFGL